MKAKAFYTVSLKVFTRTLLAGLFAALYCVAAPAALLNDTLGHPFIDATNRDSDPGAGDIDATPTQLRVTVSDSYTITGIDFILKLGVLTITGDVTYGGGRSGVLLTGALEASGVNADQSIYDFRLNVTGGLLVDLYPVGSKVGITYTALVDRPVKITLGAIPSDLVCELEVTKSCFIAPPPPADFTCDKPISEISMIWDGPASYGDVTIMAYKGDRDDLLLDRVTGVSRGDEVKVSGYAGSPNDVTWVVLDASDNELGESVFHLSCSDDDMDGETDDPAFLQDCGKREGNGKSDNGGLLNEWLLEGMVDSVGTLDCTPDTSPTPGPGPVVTECTSIATGGECTKRPTSISFKYHAGDNCGASFNGQDSGKWSCTDYVHPAVPATPDPAHITIGKAGGTTVVDDSSVVDGEILVGDKGSSYDSEILILIMNTAGGLEQEIKMHSSCSQELKIGDRFGAIEIVGFTNEEQGVVGGGPVEALYTYTITNKGDKLTVISSDDKLPTPLGTAVDDNDHFLIPQNAGEVSGQAGVAFLDEGQINLDPGATFTYQATAQLGETTTNTLTSKALLDGGPGDSFCATKTATATVTISGGSTGPGPGTGSCSVSAEQSIDISRKKVKWAIENTGGVDAIVESIELTWPGDNKRLKKVRLGKKTISSKKLSPTDALITSFKGKEAHRTIGVGQTSTFTFAFEKKVDTDPGEYTITVNFEGGCSATY